MEKKPMEESGSTGVGGNEDDLVFPGFRFHPTDQELVGFYLKRKVERKGFSIDIIKEIDVYKHDPWDLPSEAWPVVLAQGGAGEKEWYFFCLRGRKYRNSTRPNRVTGSGFWKATGIDKPIHDGGQCVGLKKSLIYYVGSAGKGTKTDWMMHEFRLRAATSSVDFHDAEIWTVCRIFKRNSSYTRRLLQPQQKQDHSGSSTKRSHQLQQKQLDQYYYGYLRHQHHYAGCASMASSFKSTTTDLSEAHHATLHCQPFQLHGFHEVSPEDVTETKTSATVGTSSPSASGWSELTSFVPDAGSTCWDELGQRSKLKNEPAPLSERQENRNRSAEYLT